MRSTVSFSRLGFAPEGLGFRVLRGGQDLNSDSSLEMMRFVVSIALAEAKFGCRFKDMDVELEGARYETSFSMEGFSKIEDREIGRLR